MKQKKWKDCPCCGAVNSMRLKKNYYDIFTSKNHPALKIGPLNSYDCTVCKEGFYTLVSRKLVNQTLAEHRAHHESTTTPVSDVMPVKEAGKFLKMTRQGVQNLMKAGKIAYVFFGNMRLPKRKAVLEYAEQRS